MAKKFIKKKSGSATLHKVNGSIATIKSKLSFLKWLDPFTYVDMFVMPQVKKYSQSSTVELVVNVLFAFIFALSVYAILGFIFGTTNPLVIVYSASMEPTLYRGDVMLLANPNGSVLTHQSFFGKEVTLDENIRSRATAEYVTPSFSPSTNELTKLTIHGIDIPYAKNASVVVYTAYPTGRPIIHRAIVKIIAEDGNFILTKGDNVLTNKTFDADCGTLTQTPFGVTATKPCITLYAISEKELQGAGVVTIPKVGCVKLWLLDDLLSLITTGALPRDFQGIC